MFLPVKFRLLCFFCFTLPNVDSFLPPGFYYRLCFLPSNSDFNVFLPSYFIGLLSNSDWKQFFLCEVLSWKLLVVIKFRLKNVVVKFQWFFVAIKFLLLSKYLLLLNSDSQLFLVAVKFWLQHSFAVKFRLSTVFCCQIRILTFSCIKIPKFQSFFVVKFRLKTFLFLPNYYWKLLVTIKFRLKNVTVKFRWLTFFCCQMPSDSWQQFSITKFICC